MYPLPFSAIAQAKNIFAVKKKENFEKKGYILSNLFSFHQYWHFKTRQNWNACT
jgi:hypothetical protein